MGVSLFKIVLPEHPKGFKISIEHQGAKWVNKKEALKVELTPGEYECVELVYPTNIVG